MADEADRADADIERLLQAQIAKVRGAQKAQQRYDRCTFCGDESDGKRYCSPECRDDAEREEKVKEKTGRR